MMATASLQHTIIKGNIYAALRGKLQETVPRAVDGAQVAQTIWRLFRMWS